MKDQIINLCLSYRACEITADEFGERLAAMIKDPDQIENIAIDVEGLVNNQRS